MMNTQMHFDFYMSILNKVASISKPVENTEMFSTWVAAAYEENGEKSTDIGWLPLLNLFLVQVADYMDEDEVYKMLEDEDIKSIYHASLRELISSFDIVDGKLVTN